MLRGWRRQENGGSEGDSFATWVEEEREEEMPSCAATKPRMQDMEDGPCCVARRERGNGGAGKRLFLPYLPPPRPQNWGMAQTLQMDESDCQSDMTSHGG